MTLRDNIVLASTSIISIAFMQFLCGNNTINAVVTVYTHYVDCSQKQLFTMYQN